MAQHEKIWDTYGKTKDPALRERLIQEFMPVVKIVAGRLSVRFCGHVDFEDMVSYGIFGLIDAIDKFDFGKGVKFETYASLRIKGSILDNIRRLDWVPRTLRQDGKRLEQVFTELENKLGREPKDSELAEALDLSLDDTRELIRKTSLASFVSLDDYLEQNHEAVSSHGNDSPDGEPEAELMRAESHDMLAGAIEKLSDKERLVVTLYYYEELTLKEISKVMGVTESRVSQIHSKAMIRLKTRLGKYYSAPGF